MCGRVERVAERHRNRNMCHRGICAAKNDRFRLVLHSANPQVSVTPTVAPEFRDPLPP
jgi:hypothetical protein